MNKNYNKIHWWQFQLNKISIKFDSAFKNKFFKLSHNYFSGPKRMVLFIQKKAKKYNRKITSDYRIIWYYRTKAKYIPAWIIYEISKKINFDMKEIEKNITSYISSSGKIAITNPKLPVNITPEFSAIAIHIMCDGTKSTNKFYYYQKNKEDQDRFVKLIKNTFGDYQNENKKGHYVPAIIATIVSEYYRIDTYLSMNCRVPDKMFDESKHHKVAILLAALQDDGNTTDRVSFSSVNKSFLHDLKNIAISLNYDCTDFIIQKPRGKSKCDFYSFKLRASSVKKFFNDINDLVKEFQTMNIGRKFDNIKKFVKYRNRIWKQRKKGETKAIILNSLCSGPKTAFELQDIITTALWTTYHHLQQLKKMNKIHKYKDGKYFKYSLIS